MSVHQEGLSQKEQTFQVLFVWVQVGSKTHDFFKLGREDTFLADFQLL